MKLEIKVNSVPLVLGETVDMVILEGADFQKIGRLRRFIKNLPAGQTVYSADNCQVECFNNDFSIYPCTHGYLNRDRQWETSATLFLSDNRLIKVEFQVIDGQYAATNFMDRFQETCSSVLGDPVENSQFLTKWHNGAAAVTSILHSDRTNADFLLELIPSS
jgi:hypothetical protein